MPSGFQTSVRFAALEGSRSKSPVGESFELKKLRGPTGEPSKARSVETKRERKRREKLKQLLATDEMKFSHSLQFNSVPDWSSHYIAYSNLKKLLVYLQ